MYLIIGSDGYLGSYIMRSVLQKTEEKIIAISRTPLSDEDTKKRIEHFVCDITDRTQVDALADTIKAYKEGLKVVFLAAYHNPDQVCKNPRFAWNINITSLSYCINRFENVKSLFYPSTDSVYGESKNMYHFKESDRTNPVNLYGRQKSTAEQVIIGYGYNVVRYPFLIGTSLLKRKKHFYDIMEQSLLSRKPIEMFSDSYRSSLDFSTAASLLIDLMELSSGQNVPSIINICGDEDLSKYDVGLMIADRLNVDRKLVVPVRLASSPGIFETARAQSTLMDNSLIKQILDIPSIHLAL
jgi:dTDP-4-dehydrorhamnose reductase